MKLEEVKKINLPDTPGVYFFKTDSEIIYIGKATSLHDRVRSYFNAEVVNARGPGIVAMVEQADSLSFTQTDSGLEALIWEALQIKKYRPKYNVREKDDKSFNFVIVTKEDYPRVLTIRGKELAESANLQKQIRYKFGPFPRGGELREAMKIIRRIFPYRTKCLPNSGKLCFDAQIGLCPGVCGGLIGQKEYGQTIHNLKNLFLGKKKDIVKTLEKQMKKAAKQEDFERAVAIRNRLFGLNHIRDVALIKNRYDLSDAQSLYRIEAYDIAHLGGKNTVGAMAVVEGGEPARSEYRHFKIKGRAKDQANDIANLTEIVLRRFGHDDWRLPNLIVIDGGQAQLSALNKIVTALELKIKTASMVKDEHHRAKNILGNREVVENHEQEILLANSEAHRFALDFHRRLRRRVL
ncbi:MAG: UvrB/UvrC motif-containing protein [Patescibacteria group bacterium]